jgi:hypothetical protein
LAFGALVAAAVSCRLQRVSHREQSRLDPGDRLSDTSLVDLMANSTIGVMQDVYSWMADYGSVYTDETRNHGPSPKRTLRSAPPPA